MHTSFALNPVLSYTVATNGFGLPPAVKGGGKTI
jgi:hypothetical protein